eukprot:1158606-Pelagomonas_calceolata.AAC.5
MQLHARGGAGGRMEQLQFTGGRSYSASSAAALPLIKSLKGKGLPLMHLLHLIPSTTLLMLSIFQHQPGFSVAKPYYFVEALCTQKKAMGA